jgi:osmoprotectant transport system ATP-binding protein
LTTADTARTEGTYSYPQAATLELRQVSKTYPGAPEPAIRELSLTVPAGEICVLVGPSGSGKTTAMRLVNRMVEPTSGDVLLDGRSVLSIPPTELRRHIGYAIQQIGLFPHQTVAQNIATVPQVLGWPRERIRARVDELIALIGLDPDEMRDRYPAQLSGGQRQRVGVARALAGDPPLLLMDEPFGAIDPITRERLQAEFLRLQRQMRKTVLFVTHDIDEAIRVGDRIAVLKGGGVLAQYGPPADLLLRPADRFVEEFVGADRALKALALRRVSDARLAPVEGGGSDPQLTVPSGAVLRDALSALLGTPEQRAVVIGEDGAATGVLTVAAIQELLVAEAARR